MKYKLLENWKKENNRYNFEQGCELCNKPFKEDESYNRVDVQTTCMRGDDEVYCFHDQCLSKGLDKLRGIYNK